MRTLILVGYRGTGKTSLGKRLARISGLPFVDTDALVVQRAGSTIPEIFDAEGEAGFRKLESEALTAALDEGPAIVATGGGIVLHPDNRNKIADSGFTVWLQAEPEELYRRIHKDANRPALTGLDPLAEICSLLELRNPLYKEVADMIVDTTSQPFEAAAEAIAERWRSPVD